MAANPFEVLGVITGVLGVWLTTRQKIWCWPVGIISVGCFIAVFFDAKLYAAMALQGVYIVLLAYGWYAWRRGGDGQAALKVTRVPPARAAALAVVGAVTSAGAGVWLGTRTDEALPWLDGFATSFSLVAQWMQARKLLENWLVWIVVDLVYVWMSLSQGLTLTAALYAVYVGLAALGFRDWRRSMAAGRLV